MINTMIQHLRERREFQDFCNNHHLVPFFVHQHNFGQFEKALDTLSICDPAFIDHSYENASYGMLSNPGFLGVFLMHLNFEKRTYDCIVSMVLDISATSVRTKFSDRQIPMPTNNPIELTLLCASTKSVRIRGAAWQLTKAVMDAANKMGEQIILFVSRTEKNEHAHAFYTRVGFDYLSKKYGIMSSQKGGRQKARAK